MALYNVPMKMISLYIPTTIVDLMAELRAKETVNQSAMLRDGLLHEIKTRYPEYWTEELEKL